MILFHMIINYLPDPFVFDLGGSCKDCWIAESEYVLENKKNDKVQINNLRN